MSKYDSILKDKKKNKKVEEEVKTFPSLLVSFILILIVLVGSYIIYFNSVLSSDNIIINNSFKILDKYFYLFNKLPLDEYNSEKRIVGFIQYKEDLFNFNLVKNMDDFNFSIFNGDRFLSYYVKNNSYYMKIYGVDGYVLSDSFFNINKLLKFKDNLSKIDKNKYKRSIYFEGEKPVVEVNFSMDTSLVNELLGINLKDDCEIIATFKNNAIMNTIEDIKLVINNKTTLERIVININEDELIYNNGKDTYKLVLEPNDKDFLIKISKNDILYSVLSGVFSDDRYIYTYQVINSKYNISVSVINSANGYLYEIVKKKDDLEEKMSINLSFESGYAIEDANGSFIDFSSDVTKQFYNEEFSYFRDKFLYFID